MRMSTQQAEVAATVHFAAQEAKNRPEGSPTEKDVLDRVMKWKQKWRPPLDEKEVAMTVRNLNMLSASIRNMITYFQAETGDGLPQH